MNNLYFNKGGVIVEHDSSHISLMVIDKYVNKNSIGSHFLNIIFINICIIASITFLAVGVKKKYYNVLLSIFYKFFIFAKVFVSICLH